MVMSNQQILQFVEEDMSKLEDRGVKPLTCVQTAGDVMIIPESWSHGVLNIQVIKLYIFLILSFSVLMYLRNQ